MFLDSKYIVNVFAPPSLMLRCICHYIQLTWKVIFCESSRDHGTLGQLFSLLKRLPAAKKTKDDMHACTDALFTVLKGYVIAAACKELGIKDMDSESIVVPGMKRWDGKKKLEFIVQLSRKVVDKCVPLSLKVLLKKL